MRYYILAILVSLILSGCTLKLTEITVYQSAASKKDGGTPGSVNQTMTLSDATFRTATDQASDGKLALAQPGGNASAGGDQISPTATSTNSVDNSQVDSNNTSTTPVVAPVVTPREENNGGADGGISESNYSNKYHHIFPNGDGTPFYTGKLTMVQCPGDPPFNSCSIGNTAIRNMGEDEGRTLWASPITGVGMNGSVLVCERGGEKFRFKITGADVRGNCQ